MNVKQVVATGIFAALYAVLSVFSIPIGISNTSLKIALIIVVFAGIMYGPLSGFLVGFIGHALYDAVAYGGVWWSWVFMSAMVGLFIGFVYYDKDLNLVTGNFSKMTVIKAYVLAFTGSVVGSLIAYLGDVYLYGESANKVVFQLGAATIANSVVLIVGITIVFSYIKSRRKYRGLDE